MNARAHLVALFAFVLLAAGPVLLTHAAPEDAAPEDAAPEEEPQSGVGGGQGGAQQDAGPPSITYGGSRSSSTWIVKPDGARVAVGKGVEWQGVKVYLSLLWDLVGVDAKTGKTLYAVNVGAFWNALGFKEIKGADGKTVWAVELRPGPRARRGQTRRQYHDLGTGKKLTPPGQVKAPSGKPFTARAVWRGKHSDVAKGFHALVTTDANWKELTKRLFGDAVPRAFEPVDFAKEVVLVVSRGDAWNCTGISLEQAFEDDKRILVRTRRHTYQTMGGAQKTRPYGVFVLPRRPKKAYVVEVNKQGLIGGPALWHEVWRLEKPGKPEAELAHVPASTKTRHDQWVK